jgi:putative transcriptional regulator
MGKLREARFPTTLLKKLLRKSRMPKRDIGLEILEGLQEIKAYKEGKLKLKTRKLEEPSSPKKIRARLKLSQAAFAALMGVSLRTVQDWEQGRRKPSGPAKSLLRIAEHYPQIFLNFV